MKLRSLTRANFIPHPFLLPFFSSSLLLPPLFLTGLNIARLAQCNSFFLTNEIRYHRRNYRTTRAETETRKAHLRKILAHLLLFRYFPFPYLCKDLIFLFSFSLRSFFLRRPFSLASLVLPTTYLRRFDF
jgi:hypothetical protein